MAERIKFGKLKEVITPPNLIEIQINSYLEFLQKEIAATQRNPYGLEAVFSEVFPIESYDGRLVLEYVSYTIGDPKNTEIECIREGVTYHVPLYVKLRLREEDFIKDEEIYMGEIPMVTKRGSFIINGAERVVVSQLHRSPGICFEVTTHPNGKLLHSFRIIPDRGTWLEAQFDNNDLLYVYLDRRRRRRKFLITTLLRAVGYDNSLFGKWHLGTEPTGFQHYERLIGQRDYYSPKLRTTQAAGGTTDITDGGEYVAEVMLTGAAVPRIINGASVQEAVEELNRKNLGAVIVTDDRDQVDGIVTDGDVRRFVADGLNLSVTKVRNVMTEGPITIPAEMQAVDALSVKQRHEITVLPVTGSDGRMVGILHLHDLLGKGEFRFLV